ncbi:MAG: transporter substrate-binding domain-containing protein [Deferribacterales bacterium]
MLRLLFSTLLAAASIFSSLPDAWAKPMFTQQEQEYIEKNKAVIVGVVNDNEPYSFFRDGAEKGFSVDFLHMMEKESGLKFKIRMGNWTDIYNAFLAGQIDVIDEISYTKERAEKILFTEPYHYRRTVFFKRADDSRFTALSPQDLKGRKIGVIKDIFYLPVLREAGLHIVEYTSYADQMKALAFGWVDAVVLSDLSGRFIAREVGLPNVQAVGNAGINKLKDEDFRLGVQKGNPVLFSVIDKTLNSIPKSGISDLEKCWATFSGREITKPDKIKLTHEEESFIRSHPAFSVGIMPDYSPFSFVSNGEVTGYTRSLLDIISRQTGITFLYSVNNWSALLHNFGNGKLDVIADITYTKERTKYTLFTDEYFRVPNVIFVRDDFGRYEGINSLKNKRVGIMSDIFYEKNLNELLEKPAKKYLSQDEMMRDLAFGNLDAVITAINAGNNVIKKYTLVNLKIAEAFRTQEINMEDLRFGVNPKYPLLYSVMKKAMLSIEPEEKLQLENQWLTAKAPETENPRNLFTEDEIRYLKDKKVIRMCVDPDWMPFEQLKNGKKHMGIAADFFALIRPKLPAKLVIVPTASWEETLLAVKSRKCDILSLAMQTEERSKYLNFTKPYLIVPNVIATSVNEPFIDGLESVMDRKFGSVKGYAITELLKQQYPELKLVEVSNDEEGIRMLQQGRIYGYIGTMPSIGYQLGQQKITDIKISARLPRDWEMGVAARNDEPRLAVIFQKLINTVSEAEKNKILGNWLSIRYDQRINYALLTRIALIAALFIAVMLYWSTKLKRVNTKLTEANIKLQELSEKDSLTGLYNRRYFSSNAVQVFGTCRREGVRFSMAILDLDHFKRINDTYGHVAGDICLQRAADVIKSHFQRDNDTAARYGGEEFAMYTTGGEETSLTTHMETLRKDIETIRVNVEGKSISMTVSIGVFSLMPDSGDTLDDVVRKADDALYKAKENGRNRVETYSG